MGVGGQRHTLATLPPAKTQCPLYRGLGRPQGWSFFKNTLKRPAPVIIPFDTHKDA